MKYYTVFYRGELCKDVSVEVKADNYAFTGVVFTERQQAEEFISYRYNPAEEKKLWEIVEVNLQHNSVSKWIESIVIIAVTTLIAWLGWSFTGVPPERFLAASVLVLYVLSKMGVV